MSSKTPMFSAANLKNFKILRDYFVTHQDAKLRMQSFATRSKNTTDWEREIFIDPRDVSRYYNECGTTCCAVGHGPLAGILPKSLYAQNEWSVYAAENFGYDLDGSTQGLYDHIGYDRSAGQIMQYLFGGSRRNSVSLLIKRLDFFLQECQDGVPSAKLKKRACDAANRDYWKNNMTF